MNETLRKELIDSGWTDNGLCGACKNKKRLFSRVVNDETWEIKIGGPYFFFYKNKHNIKADYIENLKKFIEKQS